MAQAHTYAPAPSTIEASFELSGAQALLQFLAAQNSEQVHGRIEPLFGGVLGSMETLKEALYQCRSCLPSDPNAEIQEAIDFARAYRRRRCLIVLNPLKIERAVEARVPVLHINEFTKGERSIATPRDLLLELPRLVAELMDSNSYGPVTVGLSSTVLRQEVRFPATFFAPSTHWMRRPEPDSRELAAAAAMLKGVERLVVVAGEGVQHSGAERVLEQFCRQSGARLGSLDDEAELFLCIGMRLEGETGGKTVGKTVGKPCIGLNICANDARSGGATPLVGDAKRSLELLLREMSPKGTHPKTVRF